MGLGLSRCRTSVVGDTRSTVRRGEWATLSTYTMSRTSPSFAGYVLEPGSYPPFASATESAWRLKYDLGARATLLTVWHSSIRAFRIKADQVRHLWRGTIVQFVVDRPPEAGLLYHAISTVIFWPSSRVTYPSYELLPIEYDGPGDFAVFRSILGLVPLDDLASGRVSNSLGRSFSPATHSEYHPKDSTGSATVWLRSVGVGSVETGPCWSKGQFEGALSSYCQRAEPLTRVGRHMVRRRQ